MLIIDDCLILGLSNGSVTLININHGKYINHTQSDTKSYNSILSQSDSDSKKSDKDE